jgi:hypothetical protein
MSTELLEKIKRAQILAGELAVVQHLKDIGWFNDEPKEPNKEPDVQVSDTSKPDTNSGAGNQTS